MCSALAAALSCLYKQVQDSSNSPDSKSIYIHLFLQTLFRSSGCLSPQAPNWIHFPNIDKTLLEWERKWCALSKLSYFRLQDSTVCLLYR